MKESGDPQAYRSRGRRVNGGIFLAIDDEGLEYLGPFLEGCAEAGIPRNESVLQKPCVENLASIPRTRRRSWCRTER
jgi:hypothetical protein